MNVYEMSCEELREIVNDVLWALFKLDDKPHQSWETFLRLAQMFVIDEAQDACEIMYDLGLTPKQIKEAVDFYNKHKERK